MSDYHRRPLVSLTPFDARTRRDGTVSCRECHDSEWVELQGAAPGDQPTVRPCSQCNPKAYRRWAEGWPKRDGERHHEDEFIPDRTTRVVPDPEQGQF